ncbi:MAG: patatin-like phospholipase family protein [Bacillota bacterium]|jgi:NTE family protein
MPKKSLESCPTVSTLENPGLGTRIKHLLGLGNKGARSSSHTPENLVPGIALGGGGALGLSHIGVLNVLTSAGIHFPIISGTSMGAIIGASYACGTLDLSEQMALSLTRQAVLEWADLYWDGGLLKGDVVEDVLRKLTKGLAFRDLRNRGITLIIVACNLDSGKPVYINEGDIARAVRASMSIPGLFVPVHTNGTTLVDGGLVDNVPTDIIHKLGANFTMGVDVSNTGDIWALAKSGIMLSARTADLMRQRIKEIVSDTKSTHFRHIERYHEVIDNIFTEKLGASAKEAFSRLYVNYKSTGDGRIKENTPTGTAQKEVGYNWSGIKAILQSADIMNEAMDLHRAGKLNPFKPDVLLKPNTRPFHAHQFYKAEELIEAGRQAAKTALPNTRILLGMKGP